MTRILWAPGVERAAGAKPGETMLGGVPRVVHHITWDALKKDGTPGISFDGVADYLVAVGYEPHLLIDPVGGRIKQFVPFDRSSYALANQPGGVQTNRYGTACIQVEWYFTPGVVRDGKRYASLTDTPLKGLDVLLEVADSWGIPRMWAGGNRNVNVWLNTPGHRGHRDVPENDHSDPPDPLDLGRLVPGRGSAPSPGGDEVTPDECRKIVREELTYAIAAISKPNSLYRDNPTAKLLNLIASKLGVKP